MKRLNRALIVASLALTPFVGQAVHAAGLTRAQVRAELIQSEQDGTYHTSKTHYPDVLPDFAAAYVAKKTAERRAAATGYGPATAGSSDSGAAAVPRTQIDDLYRGH
ncbi:hypothetical protein GCM10027093_27230 [Paraburkholderia jirisanensis]